jgi:hypothetical protein
MNSKLMRLNDNQKNLFFISSFFATLSLGWGIWKFIRYFKTKKLKSDLDNENHNNEENKPAQKPAGAELDKDNQGAGTELKYLDFELVKKIFKETTHITIDTFMRAYKYLEENNEALAKSPENVKIFKNEGKK